MTTESKALVSTAWLAERLSAPSIRILDASFKMPGVLPLPQDDYRREHIPGAGFFSIDAISNHDSPLPHMLPSTEAFAEAVGRLGISNSDHVILYDSNAILGASRAWWMFRVFGHTKVSVLDGGLRKWKAEARPVTEKTETPLPVKFTARFVPALLRDQAAMLANIKAPDEQIIDARAEPRDQLLALFAKARIDPQKKAATTCGSGVSACVIALALYMLGICSATRMCPFMMDHGPNGDYRIRICLFKQDQRAKQSPQSARPPMPAQGIVRHFPAA